MTLWLAPLVKLKLRQHYHVRVGGIGLQDVRGALAVTHVTWVMGTVIYSTY